MPKKTSEDQIKILKAKIIKLEAVIDAQDGIISWYSDEFERSSQDDECLPKEFIELEQCLEKAEEDLIK